jgi:hypothetical protein
MVHGGHGSSVMANNARGVARGEHKEAEGVYKEQYTHVVESPRRYKSTSITVLQPHEPTANISRSLDGYGGCLFVVCLDSNVLR